MTLDDFVTAHQGQLEQLQIPKPLWQGLKDQLEAALVHDSSESSGLDMGRLSPMVPTRDAVSLDYGAMLVLPHSISWNMLQGQGMIEALQHLDSSALQAIYNGLEKLQPTALSRPPCNSDTNSDTDPINDIADHPALWSRVILYRSNDGSVRAALPAPPHLTFAQQDQEADCTGPFAFVYHHPILKSCIDVSLLYISHDSTFVTSRGVTDGGLPTIDLVPTYQIPNAKLRTVRIAALLHGTNALPTACATAVMSMYQDFVRDMQLVHEAARQRLVEAETMSVTEPSDSTNGKVYRVYTDANDPMQLRDPICGLEANSSHFVMVDTLDEADIVYSFQSAFAPQSAMARHLQQHPNVMINQFPFEGAFVQKDHLARELLRQHGLPRPFWSLETYDLDVHLAEFVGAVVSESDHVSRRALWIIKPALGTLSKGHVVTRSLAHVIRLLDGTGGRRVAQRYIERPVCVNGRKVDCRCLVLMVPPTDSSLSRQRPTLYMHETVYFRIAHKVHTVATASDLTDHESVLTASHVLDSHNRSSNDELRKLPIASETIAKLEADYAGAFDWHGQLLPQIHTMIRQLLNGMTGAFPAMMQSTQSRALYGIDVMFELDSDGTIAPKLTEVTFCPANNAICDAYEQDDNVMRSYNKDIFECLFLGLTSPSLCQLQ